MGKLYRASLFTYTLFISFCMFECKDPNQQNLNQKEQDSKKA
jgi:hypothetical protein